MKKLRITKAQYEIASEKVEALLAIVTGKDSWEALTPAQTKGLEKYSKIVQEYEAVLNNLFLI